MPAIVTWNITNKCNLRCIYCANINNYINSVKELNEKEKFKIIKKLADYDIKYIGLTGGEFFIIRNWIDIVRRLADYNFKITINTNGTLLNQKNIIYLKKYLDYIDSISVTLDGHTKESHDRTRGEGTFNRILNNLKIAQAEGIPFDVSWSLTSQNYIHLKSMIVLCENIGAKGLSIGTLEPIGLGKHLSKNLFINKNQLKMFTGLFYRVYLSYKGPLKMSLSYPFSFLVDPETLVPLIREYRKSWKIKSNCGIFSSRLFIDPGGNIIPCNFIQKPLTNFLEVDLYEFWNSSLAEKWRRISQKPKGCKSCPYVDICGGCRAAALARTGNIEAKDPRCWYGDYNEEGYK